MLNLHKPYVNETYDENGRLKAFSLNVPEYFNFAYDVVDKIAAAEPEKTAMLWCNPEGEEHRFTFADMKRYSDRAARFFQSLGIGRGDKVMLLLKRHYEYWFCVLALHKLGAVAIPGTAMLRSHDLSYRFNAASVAAVVSTPDDGTPGEVELACTECPTVRSLILAKGRRDGWLSLHDTLDAPGEAFERPAPLRSDEPMLIYFTSGTTGQPKMVLHSFSYPLGHIVTAKHWQCVMPDGLHLSVADTGWAKAGWGKIYGQWLMEAPIFTFDYDRFDADELLTVMEKHHVTTFCAPPTIYRFFIKEGMRGHDLSCLRHACTAGEALNAEVFRKFKEYTGLMIMEGFGQTESTVLIGNLRGAAPKPGALGKPVPLYHIELIDEDGNPVAPGEVGEIAVDVSRGKPAGLFEGYCLDKEGTDKVWHDGWYHTRDTAWCDEDGFYWYVGRTDDVIKASGYRIGPFEIESVLMEHPAVRECAVTGAPDPVRGQVVKATLVLTSAFRPSDTLKKEIQDFVKKQTAPYKYPRIIEFVEELPKTVSGKIKRAALRSADLKAARAESEKTRAGVSEFKAPHIRSDASHAGTGDFRAARVRG